MEIKLDLYLLKKDMLSFVGRSKNNIISAMTEKEIDKEINTFIFAVHPQGGTTEGVIAEYIVNAYKGFIQECEYHNKQQEIENNKEFSPV